LLIEVSDDGPGFAPAEMGAEGYGLQNVRRRLQLFYGEGAELSIRSSRQGATVAFAVPMNAASSRGASRNKPTGVSA
jgi:LytS/YehU family sensor histidine kinase